MNCATLRFGAMAMHPPTFRGARRGRAVLLCLALGTAQCAAACSPDRAAPVPEQGGETGDPGVMAPRDFVTAIPSTPGGSSDNFRCQPGLRTSVAPTSPRRALDHAYHSLVMAALADRRIATAEPRFGVVLLAPGSDGALEPGPALILRDEPLSLHPMGRDRLVLVAERSALLLDVGDERPRLVDAVAFDGLVRGSAWVTSKDGRRALYAVVDEGVDERHVCERRTGTALAALAVESDRLVERPSLALGNDVTGVYLGERRALIAHVLDADWDETHPFEFSEATALQQVELSASGDMSDHGTAATVEGVVLSGERMHLDGDRLELVSAHQLQVDDHDFVRARLQRLDLAAPAVAPASCVFPLNARESSYAENARDAVVFVGGAAFAVDAWSEDATATGRVVRLTDGDQCEVDELSLAPEVQALATPQGQLLVAASHEEADAEQDADSELRLFDPQDASVPIATLRFPYPAMLDGRIAPRLLPGAEAGSSLLALPVRPRAPEGGEEDGADDEYDRGFGVELVALSSGSLEARGRLDGVSDLQVLGGRLHGVGGSRLFELDFDAQTAPAAHVRAEPWPVGGDAVVLPNALAQVRTDPDGELGDGARRIELLAPELAPREVLGEIPVPPGTRFYAVGARLVTLEPRDEPTTQIRVYDVDDPSAPRELGSLESEDIELQRAASVGVFERRLVLRTERVENEELELMGVNPHHVYGFYVVDVSDPERIEVTSIARPDEEHAHRAFVRDGILYYSYGIPLDERDWHEQRVYLVEIDLRDGEIAVGEPINVPGSVIAADVDAVYAVQATWQGRDVRSSLHRVVLDEAGAQIAASFDAGEERLVSAATFGEQLMVVANRYPDPDLPDYYGGISSRLLVLDVSGLATLGELPLPASGDVVGMADQHLVLCGKYGPAQVIDVSEPGAMRVLDVMGAGSAVGLAEGDLVYLNGDVALVRLPL